MSSIIHTVYQQGELMENSRIASENDFENGELYTNYHRFPFFKTRAKLIEKECSGKILIAGCGWGFLIEECLELNLDVWGIDASEYALQKAKENVNQSSLSRIFLANVFDDISSILKHANTTKFDWCVTEDLLPVIKDFATNQAIENMRKYANKFLHIVTPKIESSDQHPDLTWKHIEEWKEIFKHDVVVSTQGRILR